MTQTIAKSSRKCPKILLDLDEDITRITSQLGKSSVQLSLKQNLLKIQAKLTTAVSSNYDRQVNFTLSGDRFTGKIQD